MLASLMVIVGILALSVAIALAGTFATLRIVLPLMNRGRERFTRDLAPVQVRGSRPGRNQVPSAA